MAVHQTRDDRVETVLELAGSLQAGVETSVSLCERYLARIHRKDHDLHAFITVDAAFVLSEAARLDEERSKGIYRGLLHGIPIGIKDSIATAGIRTTFNSRAFADWIPAEDAPAVARLRRAGAIIIGKTNLNELTWGQPCETDLVPPARNAWVPSRLAALSSSGSAVAVASGLTPISLGTDAGGSVRLPASQMGLVGIKPSVTVPSETEWDSLSTVGVLGHTASDVSAVMAVLNPPTWDPGSRLTSLQGVTFGLPRAAIDAAECTQDVCKQLELALSLLGTLGAAVVEVNIPNWRMAAQATFIMLCALQSGSLAWLAEPSRTLLGESVKRQLLAGAFVSPADLDRCQSLRRAFERELREMMGQKNVAALITPVSPNETPVFDPTLGKRDFTVREIFTAPVNLVGWAAVSVPAGVGHDGIPLGLQFIAPPNRDTWLLDAAALFMSQNGWRICGCI